MSLNEISPSIEYSKKVLDLARETIMMRYRFFNSPLSRITVRPDNDIATYSFNDSELSYNPNRLLKDYLEEVNFPVRLLLHVLLHGLFRHRALGEGKIPECWNFASDIAVENIILKLKNKDISLIRDGEAESRLVKLSKWIPSMTAPKIYRELAVNGISKEAGEDYIRLFSMDLHPLEKVKTAKEDIIVTEEEWKRLAERVKTEITSFGESEEVPSELLDSLRMATRPGYDYEAMLTRFAALSEEIKVNPEEFDYLFYTYGLTLYGDMPLVEPLEYAEERKIRDFVIVIDTSASCRGDTVEGFLRKTCEILKTSESFSNRINIHIIQCDAMIRKDSKIESLEELEDFIENMSIKGFGATDFRPAFSYVDELLARGEFTNLKGLIYFTDGYGVYPEKAPEYDVMFAFLGEDEMRPKLPVWAIKAVLDIPETL